MYSNCSTSCLRFEIVRILAFFLLYIHCLSAEIYRLRYSPVYKTPLRLPNWNIKRKCAFCATVSVGPLSQKVKILGCTSAICTRVNTVFALSQRL